MTSENYSIKDLEKLSGVKAHTIRIWEKRYGIIIPARTVTNIRYYSNEDLKKILNISLLNQHGYKISVISQMTNAELSLKVAELSLVNSSEDQGIQDNLLLSLINMDEQQFIRSFNAVILRHGFETGVAKVIFPFFNRIGVMWQSGSINTAQEHFFSSLLRNKIVVATDGLLVPRDLKNEVVLLFLPEQELHEIGLLYYNYLLRARGYHTIYLGQAVPIDSLARVIEVVKPSFVVSSLTSPVASPGFLNIASQLSQIAPDAKLFFAGPVSVAPKAGLPENVFFIKDLLKILQIEM